MSEHTYYLRSPAHKQIVPGFTKTDGTVVPERVFDIEERALYRHHNFLRFYRDSYPEPNNAGLRLYTAKKLKTILLRRRELFDYCGEWFDVYTVEAGKVDLTEEATQ